jgi:phospholipid N-methyltransferase
MTAQLGPDTPWLAYYNEKRIVHQWMQVALLAGLPCRKILEVGPALGLVTSMLLNAGYDVDTLDMMPRAFRFPEVRHIERNLLALRPEEITGYDAIICCETLEHVPWRQVGDILTAFHGSGAPYLLVSVPYMGLQLTFDLYLNRYVQRQYFSFKKLLSRRNFVPGPEGDHQWEVGYKGYDLPVWERRITESGWAIERREFSELCRSVFHLLRR